MTPAQPEMTSTDPRALRLHRPPATRDVPFVPTGEPVVAAMLRLAGVGPGDVVYDLGCGDGRICVAAARKGATAVGVDVDLQRVREAYEAGKRAGVGDRARFVRASLFDVDIRPATAVTLYLLPAVNLRLRPKLLWELRPGARVVSNYFDMGQWEPDARVEVHHRVLYQWVVPAWVEGEWRCVVNGPAGRRAHMTLRLRRRFQFVTGAAQVGRRAAPIADGRLRGADLTFAVPADPLAGGQPARYAARYDGTYLRGTADLGGGAVAAWGGVRSTRHAGAGLAPTGSSY